MDTFSKERKEKILYALDNFGKITVRELAKNLKVTPETIRRDLDNLEGKRRLKRVHGGAVKISYDKIEPSYMARREVYKAEKEMIGKRGAELINDGDIIAIDVGTTTCEVLAHLKDKKNLTVILNSVFALNKLIDYQIHGDFNGKIIFLGGEINFDQLTTFGPICENILNQFYIDKSFIAVGGMDLSSGLTGYDIHEANLSKQLMLNSKEVIVLADHSKVGVRNFYKIVDYSHVDVIVCDESYPAEWKATLSKEDINWIVVGE